MPATGVPQFVGNVGSEGPLSGECLVEPMKQLIEPIDEGKDLLGQRRRGDSSAQVVLFDRSDVRRNLMQRFQAAADDNHEDTPAPTVIVAALGGKQEPSKLSDVRHQIGRVAGDHEREAYVASARL